MNRWERRAQEMEAVAACLGKVPYLWGVTEIAERYARIYRKKANRWWRRSNDRVA